MHVSWMRSACEAVGDPDIHTLIKCSHVVAQFTEIYSISHREPAFIEAQSQRSRPSMGLVNVANGGTSEAQILAEFPRLDNGAVEVRLREGISEAQLQFVENVPAGMERHRTANRLGNRSQLVDPMAMIAMRMSDDDAVAVRDLRREPLLPAIRAAI